MKRSGFTLIELLVVIAIIAILAAILFPVFAQAREKARAISCLSNEKQMVLGLIQYSQDSDEQMPPAWIGYPTVGYPGKARWMDVIQPYVKSTAVFTDPDSNTKYVPVPANNIVNDTDPATGAQYRAENGGYAMNVAYFNSTTGHPPTPIPDVAGNDSRSLAAVADPSGTVWIMDFVNGGDSFQCAWPAGVNLPIITTVTPRTLGAGGYLRELHQGRTNVAFCDGHAKAVTLDYLTEKTKTGPNAGSYCHWSVEDDCN
ncbi:hypothetical protein CCAX7_31960 [Capsulimonas corticalis]|uniref:Uncharacterized protein n=1 Tax=Capsulimonas corticalis TaxID=2219043 RepID=A0A402D452_9BACT|nr:DUF1559 domain-containing protein [Capsulimonas corticalis]BDI31145.1 hypothetical protein CCAX7_31960 [Capsulimonas corticalis]